MSKAVTPRLQGKKREEPEPGDIVPGKTLVKDPIQR